MLLEYQGGSRKGTIDILGMEGAHVNARDLMQTFSRKRAPSTACSGSPTGPLIDLLPAHALTQREGTTFSSDAYTAREFDIMRPKRLGERPMAVACSHSGNAPEVIRSCKIAHEAGAAVITFTNQDGSGIDLDLWTSWVYPWSDDVSQLKVSAGITLLLAGELLDQQEGHSDLNELYEGVAVMDQILPAARIEVNEELGERFAALCQEHPFLYILGSGPNFSQAYGFAICSLQEMQWHGCAYIHSAEYFHGPFECTEPGVFYFLQMGSSKCRAMDERALVFLKTHTNTFMVLDAIEYGMDRVPEGGFELISLRSCST